MKRFLDILPESVKKAAVEALRLVLLAVLPILILGIDLQTGAIAINWMLVKATALITVLRFIDKWLHEKGKESGEDGWLKTKGLTGF